MSRTARIELRPAEIVYFVQTDDTGNEWTSEPSAPSKRPHYLRLVASNGETLAHSEDYPTRSGARRAAKAWLEAFFQVGGGDDPDCRPVPVREFDAAGKRTR